MKRASFIIPLIISIVMLLIGIPKGWPYSYYILLRWVVCGSAAYTAWISYELERVGWAWAIGIIALIFNPIFPTHLNKETWVFIDIIVVIIFVFGIFLIKNKKEIR